MSSQSSNDKVQQPSTETAISESLSLLVINLNRFNTAFAENTIRLGEAIDKLNAPTEAEKAMRQAFTLPAAADIRRVANTQIETLEQMQELMNRYRSELSRTASLTDAQLGSAMTSLRESASSNIESLNAMFVAQSEEFKRILNDEKEAFEKMNHDIALKMSDRLREMPRLAEQLDTLAAIPERLERLIETVEASSAQAMVNVNRSIRQALNDAVAACNKSGNAPSWTSRLTAAASVVSAICLIIILFTLL